MVHGDYRKFEEKDFHRYPMTSSISLFTAAHHDFDLQVKETSHVSNIWPSLIKLQFDLTNVIRVYTVDPDAIISPRSFIPLWDTESEFVKTTVVVIPIDTLYTDVLKWRSVEVLTSMGVLIDQVADELLTLMASKAKRLLKIIQDRYRRRRRRSTVLIKVIVYAVEPHVLAPSDGDVELGRIMSTIPASTASIERSLEKVVIDKVCAVCYEEFESAGPEGARMPCCHVFHRDCITRWLRKSNSCPICRYKLAQ